MQWMYNDIIGAAAGFVMFSVFGIVILFLVRRSQEFPTHKCYMSIIAILILVPILIYSKVIYDTEKQRERTDDVVFSLKRHWP
jgi:hypothetical protein